LHRARGLLRRRSELNSHERNSCGADAQGRSSRRAICGRLPHGWRRQRLRIAFGRALIGWLACVTLVVAGGAGLAVSRWQRARAAPVTL
jgi:hypothetical protein